MKELTLLREKTKYPEKGEAFTLGLLLDGGAPLCYTVEDEVRPEGEKVYGLTAIPEGVYTVRLTMSNRFKKMLPLLEGVPMFEGVRIHGGNRAENSEGCIIVGTKRTVDGVANCQPALDAIIEMIAEHGEVKLTIENGV